MGGRQSGLRAMPRAILLRTFTSRSVNLTYHVSNSDTRSMNFNKKYFVTHLSKITAIIELLDICY